MRLSGAGYVSLHHNMAKMATYYQAIRQCCSPLMRLIAVPAAAVEKHQ
ncbi:hypothetical protein KKH3_22040 [Pectobacterium actinidiae]|nr:hypothetical protein KKH3_22040 [Pectobacterium actinidiae]